MFTDALEDRRQVLEVTIVGIAFQTDAMMTSCVIHYPSVVNRTQTG